MLKAFESDKTYKIYTWGCQMNEYDSEYMAGILEDMGYKEEKGNKCPDIFLFNTCTIRQKAEQKFWSTIGRYKGMKKDYPECLFIVCGCVAQKEKENIFKKFPFVDAVIGTDAIYNLKTHIENCLSGYRHLCDVSFSKREINNNVTLKRLHRVKAWIKIMEGCNNFCSFCIVPYVRGRERSKRAEDIISEINQVVSNGYKEITLLGQNVNSYRGEKGEDFPQLLENIAEKTRIRRIRFTTSHPKDLSQNLINTIANLDPVCKHIHLPVQSGSNNILKLMNRKYTSQEYMKKIEQLRDKVPQIGISTDIIVGFPGESQSDFEETVKLLENVRFNSIFAFQYSPREGTKAAVFERRIPFKESRKRLNEILNLQREISEQLNKDKEGTYGEVLIEKVLKEDNSFLLSGRLSDNTSVSIRHKDMISPGSFRKIRVIGSSAYGLKGEVTVLQCENP